MNTANYFGALPDEKPLDRMVANGGLCGIFRTIGCIGDSLSSGEFQVPKKDGDGTEWNYIDVYDYSWGQYIARSTGSKVYNFSRGGMTAREYWDSFAEENGYWAPDKLCQAYILALGVNDLGFANEALGSVEDIHMSDFQKNAQTFAGYYARIIQRLKMMQPKARFFLMTMPRDGSDEDKKRAAHAALLQQMTELFDYTYLIDLYTYAPVYDAEFRHQYYLNGHMNPAGYLLTARMVESYIDYIIRHNPEAFYQVGLIGTDYYDTSIL